MSAARRYDILILGSGFGGSLLATILCRRGLRVAMIDRDRHPRFAIGESATPAADLILHDLATRHDLPSLKPLTRFGTWQATYPRVRHGCKRGFSYFWHGDGFRASDEHEHELLVAASGSRETADCQWYRADVDQLFARTATKASAELMEEADVIALEHPRPRDWRVSFRRDGHAELLAGAFLVDATGPGALLPRHLGLRDLTGTLATRSSAVFGHWHPRRTTADWLGERDARMSDHPFPCDDAAVHHVFRDGWLWQLRFEEDVTSFGFVFAGADRLRPSAPGGSEAGGEAGTRGRQATDRDGQAALEVWNALRNERPLMRQLLDGAELAEFPGRLFRTGRLQRLWSAGAGADWACLPFTVGFIDPLHSTGIAHALSGVERLAEALTTSEGGERERMLSGYSSDVVAELRWIDRLVAGCYQALGDFNLFRTWSMWYFAAATTFEQRRLEGADTAAFLGARDPALTRAAEASFADLTKLTSHRFTGKEVRAFGERVWRRIAPFNHVGLFAPPVPHMYHYTAAEKPH